jgi:hypothetical protein
MPHAAWLVFVNEFRLLARDRVGVFMLVVAPVVIILVAGLSLGNVYGVGAGRGAYVVPIIDDDHGVVARSIISALEHESAVRILKVDKLDLARAAVEAQDRTPLAIIIPAGATRSLETGGEAQLELYVDPVRRLEVSAIELHLNELCREISVRAQREFHRKLVQQDAIVRHQLEQAGQYFATTVQRYQGQLRKQRATVEASLKAQMETIIGQLEKESQATIERLTAEVKSALARDIASRRDAITAVSRYLGALQASEHEFDNWFAALKAIADAHRVSLPPPPTLPASPPKEELSELSKPILVPEIAPAPTPVLPRLRVKLPALPQPPHLRLPAGIDSSVSLITSGFPGYLGWREHPITGDISEPNAFDQYVPGFGITFLLIAMLMAIGMGLIDERDWGTLHRLRVSGAPLLGVLTGKMSCRFIIGLLQMVVLFAVGRGLFGISLGRNPLMLLIPTAAMSFAAAAFSLVIACVARTHDSVMPIGAVAAMAMSAVGGCWWPLDFEPAWMRTLARLLPTTWTMRAYNDLMIRHAPAVSALTPTAFIAALGLLYLMIGMVAASKLYD